MVAAAMTETLALRRPARARRRPGRERTMQFQAWRATTARRAIPGESGVREICMRRLEGRAEVAGQRWPAASPDPTEMAWQLSVSRPEPLLKRLEVWTALVGDSDDLA